MHISPHSMRFVHAYGGCATKPVCSSLMYSILRFTRSLRSFPNKARVFPFESSIHCRKLGRVKRGSTPSPGRAWGNWWSTQWGGQVAQQDLVHVPHRRVQELLCNWLFSAARCFAVLRNKVFLRGGIRAQAALHVGSLHGTTSQTCPRAGRASLVGRFWRLLVTTTWRAR